VIANASFSFIGNIDQSIDQLTNSYEHDLFVTLPKAFDLAIQDRFFYFLPGWEIPKMDNKFFTHKFGLITDYMAEAFHYMFKHNKDYVDIVGKRLKLGSSVQGRDELAIKKTVTALLKIIHPSGNPSEQEFNDIVEYAIEGRRRVKEQMNKRKPDDEFALINLSYFDGSGKEIVVFCPESKNSTATQNPRKVDTTAKEKELPTSKNKDTEPPLSNALVEKRIKVYYGDIGYGFESVFSDYLPGAKGVIIEDPYIRKKHQIVNFIRFCEMLVKTGDCKNITLITGSDDNAQSKENALAFDHLADDLFDHSIEFRYEFNNILHDREIKLSNGWNIRMGRGLDYFQSLSNNYLQIGANDLDLRPCLETSFDFYKV
jgi:ATP-dependent Lon protease